MQEGDWAGEKWCHFVGIRGLYLSASEKPVVPDAFLTNVIQRSTKNDNCANLDR